MSIVQKLTEGIVSRNMAQEGQALLDKWSATGLLEGLQSDNHKHNMARLLENQAKELLRESSSMTAGDVEGFAAVAFPIVRRVFAGLIANDLVSVQPMSLPSGLIFFLDFVYSPDAKSSGGGLDPRFGNDADASIYGTNKKGSGIEEGVDLIDTTTKADLSGPRGMVGYAYASPSGSNSTIIGQTEAEATLVSTFTLDGNVSAANKKLIKFDPDLLSVTDSTLMVGVLDIAQASHSASLGSPDLDNLAAFDIKNLTGTGGLQDADGAFNTLTGQIRRLTQAKDTGSSLTNEIAAIRYVVVGSNITAGQSGAFSAAGLAIDSLIFPVKDDVTAGTAPAGGLQGYEYAMEGIEKIPEIDIKVDSSAITAQTKKLKAKWTPELGQDLNAYHNLDAEVELTSILSEQIALEIDREILADLVNGAHAATYYWSRSPGLFVNRETGLELGAASAAPDFTGTVSEWYETLVETINDVSAQIHRKTLRGGANFVVVSPEVANILEFTAGFRANVTADADKGDIGAVNVGSLSRKFDVLVDPYFPRNVVLVGRKGSSFLESGYVYAPYVPLQTTPTIFGPEDFVPRKGVMTRYAKKMVRPDMYGLVIVRGLAGEEGSS